MDGLEPERVDAQLPQGREVDAAVVGVHQGLEGGTARKGVGGRVDVEDIDFVNLHAPGQLGGDGDAVVPPAEPSPVGLSADLVAAGQAVGAGFDRIGGEGIGPAGSGEGDGLKVPVGGVDARGVSGRLGIGGSRRKDAVVDAVPVGVGAGPVAVVEVGPELDLADGDARGKRNGDGNGIVAGLVDVQFAGGVLGVEGAGGGCGNGEGGGGRRGGDGEGKGAGGGGGLGGGRGGAAVVVNVGGAGEGRAEGGGKIVFEEGADGGWHGDRAFPDLDEAGAVVCLVVMPAQGGGLPGAAGHPVIEGSSRLIVAAGVGFVDTLVKGDAGVGQGIEGIAHSGGVDAGGSGFGRHVPDVAELGEGGQQGGEPDDCRKPGKGNAGLDHGTVIWTR